MLMENCQADCSKYGHMELKNINKEIVSWLEDVIEENNSRIERKEWKSKYNSYVVYDYEPFCADGFEINLLVSSYDYSYLNFIKYLYDEKINTIEYLNNCIGVWWIGWLCLCWRWKLQLWYFYLERGGFIPPLFIVALCKTS